MNRNAIIAYSWLFRLQNNIVALVDIALLVIFQIGLSANEDSRLSSPYTRRMLIASVIMELNGKNKVDSESENTAWEICTRGISETCWPNMGPKWYQVS